MDYHCFMAFRRLLAIGHRLIVAVLALALSSQLVQGQLVRCGEMDMSKVGATGALVPSSNHSDQTRVPASSSCVVAGICLNGPALPNAMAPAFTSDVESVAISYGLMPPEALAIQPESPPPRR